MLSASHSIATRPFPGEYEIGDLAFILPTDESAAGSPPPRILAGLIDGAGHGPEAAHAAHVGYMYLQKHDRAGVLALLDGVHGVMPGTRGAVAALVTIDLVAHTLEYGGVGNVEGRIMRQTGQDIRLISYNGLLGSVLPRVRTFHHHLEEGDTLVLHSDGVSAYWGTSGYPGIQAESPHLVASILLRDWGRQTDDATVLAIRFTGVPRLEQD